MVVNITLVCDKCNEVKEVLKCGMDVTMILMMIREKIRSLGVQILNRGAHDVIV